MDNMNGSKHEETISASAILRDARMCYVNDYTTNSSQKPTNEDEVIATRLCDAIMEAYDNFDGEIIILSRFRDTARYELELSLETKRGICLAGMVSIEAEAINVEPTYSMSGIALETYSDMFARHKTATLTMYHSDIKEYIVVLQDEDGDLHNPIAWYQDYCMSELEEDITQNEAETL